MEYGFSPGVKRYHDYVFDSHIDRLFNLVLFGIACSIAIFFPEYSYVAVLIGGIPILKTIGPLLSEPDYYFYDDFSEEALESCIATFKKEAVKLGLGENYFDDDFDTISSDYNEGETKNCLIGIMYMMNKLYHLKMREEEKQEKEKIIES